MRESTYTCRSEPLFGQCTEFERDALTEVLEGYMIFNSTTDTVQVFCSGDWHDMT